MLPTTQGFNKHLATNESEKTERNPVAEALDKVSEREAPEPAQHRHEHLESTKPPAWPQGIAESHLPYPAPICHGNRECVHRKPHGYNENSPETHMASTTTVALQATPETTMVPAGRAQRIVQKSIPARTCFTSRSIDIN
jgi:hypothetical protein